MATTQAPPPPRRGSTLHVADPQTLAIQKDDGTVLRATRTDLLNHTPAAHALVVEAIVQAPLPVPRVPRAAAPKP
ncbi:uncharacterized protein LOC62_01G000912 [Vanrija pseudolonga]|uniref:Uncharacterized protein n=1 Tax=Vanrija pseudolonga TaxID=143232 RepID=A0AAF1BFE0_9TREE|nr:hypothetical protein LOC62_01G000912 [Vanrija pseudolonga]